MRIHAFLARAGLTAAVLWSVPAFAADFRADLDPASHDNSTRLQVQGEGSVTGTLTGNSLKLSGSFSGIHAPAAKARLGIARVLGAPATSFFADLSITSATSGSISGALTLTPAQVAALNGKTLFLQIDSTNPTPNGTLWGWFLPVAARSAR